MAYLFAAVFPGSWEEVGEQALETFEAALGNALEAVAAAADVTEPPNLYKIKYGCPR